MSLNQKKLLIAGAGGHGKVVAEAALASGLWHSIAFVDDAYPSLSDVLGLPVISDYHQAGALQSDFPAIVVALGDHEKRLRLAHQFLAQGFELATVIHPSAVVSPSSTIGAGTVVFANSVINACADIGRNCIINTGVVVEHDTVLGDGVHISPNATLSGGVKIGANSWVGAGATIIHQIQLGANTIVGAGAVVLQNVPEYTTVVGVPANPIGVCT